jgi:hypothetical protein
LLNGIRSGLNRERYNTLILRSALKRMMDVSKVQTTYDGDNHENVREQHMAMESSANALDITEPFYYYQCEKCGSEDPDTRTHYHPFNASNE